MFLNFTENEIENAINSKEYMEMKNVFTNKECMDKLEEIKTNKVFSDNYY